MAAFETTLLRRFTWASNQLDARVDNRGDEVLFAPEFPILKTVLTQLGVTLLGVGGYLFALWHEQQFPGDSRFRYLWAAFYTLGFIGMPVIVYLDYRFGVRVKFDRVKQAVSLLNTGETWPRTSVIGWQIVYVNNHTDSDDTGETQWIVLVHENDRTARHLLFAGLGPLPRLRDLVEEFARATHIPLVSAVSEGREEFTRAGLP